MGVTNSVLLQEKYNREFNREDINNKNVFDRQELESELRVSKGGSEQFEIIDKGIKIINEKDNMSLMINGASHITLKDNTNNMTYDLLTRESYPNKKKYCVKVDEQEYCTCDCSVINLVMDMQNMELRLKKMESKL